MTVNRRQFVVGTALAPVPLTLLPRVYGREPAKGETPFVALKALGECWKIVPQSLFVPPSRP